MVGMVCSPSLRVQSFSFFPAAHGIASGKAAKRSIADSEESEAYKSLFTTHSSAKRSKEESAHWVTHTSYCF